MANKKELASQIVRNVEKDLKLLAKENPVLFNRLVAVMLRVSLKRLKNQVRQF